MNILPILISQTERFLAEGEPIHPAVKAAAQQVVDNSKKP